MGGGRYEYSTDVGESNAATAGVVGNTLCVPNYCSYFRLDTELSGRMSPASPQVPPPYFGRRMISNNIYVDEIGGPGRVE